MGIETTLLKIDVDLAAGRKGLAVKRLRSLIVTYPNDLSLRNRLAEIYYDAGFIDTAGRYWFLSEPENDKMREAVAIYEQTVGSAQHVLDDLGRLKDIEAPDGYAKNKLAEFDYRCQHENMQRIQRTKDTWIEKYGVIVFAVAMLCFVWGVISLLASVFNALIDYLSGYFKPI